MKKIPLLLVVFLMFASVGFAENVYKKDGTVIRNARIIGRNSYSITVSGQGRIFNEDIERIGEDIVEEPLGGVKEDVSNEAKENVEEQEMIEDKPKDELIIDLFAVNGMKETVDNTISTLMTQIPEKKKEELKRMVDAKELLNSLVPVYDQEFSKEEIKDLIKFYKSSAGSKLLKDTPKIMEKVMVASVDYFKGKIKENQE
ncbi:MAG: DUF2059 domain-containing protein, partial [Candidatus Omnitrophica bacterium]|nr:DUF2059 domain-containing protein [Candidatus Omnitrophota bacterium]